MNLITTQLIENRIFTFRGTQVMIDRDLAELYHVEVKRLNEQVKRNFNRFPESFRFQLSVIEKEELVAKCDRNIIFDNLSYLSPDELTALSFCQIEGSISNQRLQYVLNLHSSDITNLLKKLCADGYLKSDNNGRWTTYKLKQKVATSNKNIDNQGVKNKKVATSNRKVDASGKNIDNQEVKNKKDATSNRKVATSEEKDATSIDEVINSDLNIQKIRGKSLKKNELENIILKICKDQYVKKEVIAEILGKSENYIRNRILPQMLKESKLEKRYPFTHNHPQQGYKTSEEYAKKL